MTPSYFAAVTAVTIGCLIGCSSSKSPDVEGPIRQSLNQAGLSDVSVSQDRDKGVVTLGGHVADDSAKAQAETIARSNAAGQVVANEISVTPAGNERDAKAVNSDLDDGIKKNLDAALIQNNLHKSVNYDVKNGVVTLSRRRPLRKPSRSSPWRAIASGCPERPAGGERTAGEGSEGDFDELAGRCRVVFRFTAGYLSARAFGLRSGRLLAEMFVRKKGLEPLRRFRPPALRLARLPIPPLPLRAQYITGLPRRFPVHP